jgi:hypothetical protein
MVASRATAGSLSWIALSIGSCPPVEARRERTGAGIAARISPSSDWIAVSAAISRELPLDSAMAKWKRLSARRKGWEALVGLLLRCICKLVELAKLIGIDALRGKCRRLARYRPPPVAESSHRLRSTRRSARRCRNWPPTKSCVTLCRRHSTRPSPQPRLTSGSVSAARSPNGTARCTCRRSPDAFDGQVTVHVDPIRPSGNGVAWQWRLALPSDHGSGGRT